MWAIKKFNLYIFNSEFDIITDHKPLLPIFNNKHHKPTARIERWLISIQHHKFRVKYEPGSKNPADFLSRDCHSPSKTRMTTETEFYLNYVSYANAEKCIPLHEIEQATENDQVLKTVK